MIKLVHISSIANFERSIMPEIPSGMYNEHGQVEIEGEQEYEREVEIPLGELPQAVFLQLNSLYSWSKDHPSQLPSRMGHNDFVRATQKDSVDGGSAYTITGYDGNTKNIDFVRRRNVQQVEVTINFDGNHASEPKVHIQTVANPYFEGF